MLNEKEFLEGAQDVRPHAAPSEREANVSAASLSFGTFLSAMRKKSTFIKKFYFPNYTKEFN